MSSKRKQDESVVLLIFVLVLGLFFGLAVNEPVIAVISFLALLTTTFILIHQAASKKRAHRDYIRRLQASDMASVDQMTGRQFELYLEVMFQALGYQTEQLPTTNDFGADLILVTAGKRIAVQAKRYKGNVGNRAVQMILGAKKYYGCQEAWIVTNSFYTKAAIQMSSKTDVLLIDRNGLLNLMTQSQQNKKDTTR
jgi:restriction system protein